MSFNSRRAMLVLVIVSLVVFAFSTMACSWDDLVRKEVEVVTAQPASDTRPLCQNILEMFREKARQDGVCKD